MHLFLIGCNSSSMSYKNSEPNLFKPLKALVFYASDDPIWFPYFSNVFTRRISEEGIFSIIQSHELNREWILNSLENKEDINLENRFLHLANKIKEYIRIGQLQNAQKLSISSMNEASNLLARNPVSVSFSYSILSFWSAVANLKLSESRAKSYALIYEKYSSFYIKDSLESQVDPKIIDKLKSLTAPMLTHQRTVKILNSKNCTIFIDGQEIKSNTVILPDKMKSVLTASCLNGVFSKMFTAEQNAYINIIPRLSFSFNSMPNIKALPKEKILITNSSVIVLIFWSHFDKYMEAFVLNSQNFTIVKKTRIPLVSQQDLNEAGDNLIVFLKSIKLIDKNLPKSLTSSVN